MVQWGGVQAGFQAQAVGTEERTYRKIIQYQSNVTSEVQLRHVHTETNMSPTSLLIIQISYVAALVD